MARGIMVHPPDTTSKAPAQICDNLRVALFSGNYNYVRDGANQALNRLVGHLQKRGAQVRVYSPRTATPAFASTGKLVGVPSIPFPGRNEYRFPVALSPRVRRDLAEFAPNVIHVSSPDWVGHRAVSWARARKVPVLASVHTRFETYPRYYSMAWIEPVIEAMLRRYYRRCDALVAPSESFAQLLREQRMNYDVGLWTRGVDHERFNPARRDLEWRRSLGIADHEFAIGFLGRLVMEKGLDVFSDSVDELARRGVPHKVFVVGQGPARDWFEARLPEAKFAGFQQGADLARAVASMDVLFNPSITEAFGNVTLEAMACGVSVVAAAATGSQSIVDDGVSGRLIAPGAVHAFAEALRGYALDPAMRARHGAAGAERALDYDWDAINQTVADTYQRLIRQKARRAG